MTSPPVPVAVPALVIGLDGATEYRLVPRIMETLGLSKCREHFAGDDGDPADEFAEIARVVSE